MAAKAEKSNDDVKEFVITECKTDTVVVFLDRAEVTRSLKVTLDEGQNEVILKDMSPFVDQDSVRVEGQGTATIMEVAFQTKHLTADEDQSTEKKCKRLQRDLEDATRTKEVMELKQARLRKQRDVLDGFANNAMQGAGVASQKTEIGVVMQDAYLSKDNLVGMTAFLELFDRQADKVDGLLHEVKRDIAHNADLIRTIQANIRQLNYRGNRTDDRTVIILLHAEKATTVDLSVSYIISNANWSPKYDIRVNSSDHLLKIHYHGLIQQSTGEDWNDAHLCLSTAVPSIGGVIPDLGTCKLSFKRKPEPMHMNMMKGRPMMRRSLMMAAPAPPGGAMMAEMACDEPDMPQMAEMTIAQTEVKESITTTMYEIARRSTIPSDNVGHKVTVAIIDLKPTMEYQSVPSASTTAFLKAKVKNTSPYALLEGPTNIFVDNNFIAKSVLKAVSPNEEFTCSLGADPAVRVSYPAKKIFREQSGLISKVTSTTHRQIIEIKNTHKDAIKITISDRLPLSTEDKIKVRLEEPSIKHMEKYDPTKPIRLNAKNNIEWEIELAGGETQEIILKYNIEHPSNQELDTQFEKGDSSSSQA